MVKGIPILGVKCILKSNKCHFGCDWSRHIQESRGALGPKSPKSLKNGFPGLPARSVKKVSKNSQMTRTRLKKTTKSVFGDFFDTFLTLPAGRPGKSFLRLFGVSGLGGVETPVYGDCARNILDLPEEWPQNSIVLVNKDDQKQAFWTFCLTFGVIFRGGSKLPFFGLRWPGDSQRESIRRKNKKKTYFHKVRAIRANRLKSAIRKIFVPRNVTRKKGVHFGNPQTIRANQPIRENLRIDSRESGHLSFRILRCTFGVSGFREAAGLGN